MSTDVHAVSNLHVHSEERVFWYAMNAARERKFIACVRDSWVSDVTILGEAFGALEAKLLWEEAQPALARYQAVVEVDGAVIQIAKDRRDFNCAVFAPGIMTANDHFSKLRKLLPDAARQENLLDVTFWYGTQHGPRRYDRQLAVPKWKDITNNYPAATRESLTQLLTVKPDEGRGKLILWQGEPGTGKTFALRALGEEWAPWCRMHFVIDSENFFNEGDYLLSVILEEDNTIHATSKPNRVPPWRLVVLEDAGDLLAKDARVKAGQGLSRLLNLTSGMLGQGLRVLVLITTNEEMGSLNEAVSRSGRCLSKISFEKFNAMSATQWLGDHGHGNRTVDGASTLADLYAIVNGNERPSRQPAGFAKGGAL